MNKRPTIKDIARKACVSTGTVHLVLQQKKGASEETRERVKRIALEMGYQPNAIAAGLKRKSMSIAVVLPVRTSMNRFYFHYQWDGIRDYIDTLRDYNVEMIAAPYYDTQLVPATLLETLLSERKLHGLITTGFVNAAGAAVLRRFNEAEIPVVLLGSDVPDIRRLCSVQAPYEIIGAMMAEQLWLQARGQKGKYLIGTGSAQISSHYRVVDGFRRFLTDKHLENDLLPIAAESFSERSSEHYVKALQTEHCVGCCAVSARDSVALAEALLQSGLAGHVPAIGSDVFPENVQYMHTGVFNNLLQKNPYQQAYVAAQYMAEYLLQGKHPSKDIVTVGGEMVYQSNLPLYDNGFYRLLL